ncbi:uncharacterized protein AMSG_04378 [Thecamonas trahens ATCC 50062]|uniref:Uncharacterized protein n=1 Tax=Thecamonas trahens ATCC 50062 TaxID=461836 RepID=A0A0L0D725_THETB|nr:hypothetical protein AMSG_04378 [Thecamonas trahens ATCC 50062]KNC48149.1 hypothetical protein AMSG_04378 [Thecamonas trahens ATCC 50062]|eukprot:XP_013758719.1 hypothetical protein AMSG_04378 [Thecamonas trahens ATCC 50062]
MQVSDEDEPVVGSPSGKGRESADALLADHLGVAAWEPYLPELLDGDEAHEALLLIALTPQWCSALPSLPPLLDALPRPRSLHLAAYDLLVRLSASRAGGDKAAELRHDLDSLLSLLRSAMLLDKACSPYSALAVLAAVYAAASSQARAGRDADALEILDSWAALRIAALRAVPDPNQASLEWTVAVVLERAGLGAWTGHCELHTDDAALVLAAQALALLGHLRRDTALLAALHSNVSSLSASVDALQPVAARVAAMARQRPTAGVLITPQAWLAEGRAALARHEWDAALGAYLRAVDSPGTDAQAMVEAYANASAAALRVDRPHTALHAAQRALSMLEAADCHNSILLAPVLVHNILCILARLPRTLRKATLLAPALQTLAAAAQKAAAADPALAHVVGFYAALAVEARALASPSGAADANSDGGGHLGSEWRTNALVIRPLSEAWLPRRAPRSAPAQMAEAWARGDARSTVAAALQVLQEAPAPGRGPRPDAPIAAATNWAAALAHNHLGLVAWGGGEVSLARRHFTLARRAAPWHLPSLYNATAVAAGSLEPSLAASWRRMAETNVPREGIPGVDILAERVAGLDHAESTVAPADPLPPAPMRRLRSPVVVRSSPTPPPTPAAPTPPPRLPLSPRILPSPRTTAVEIASTAARISSQLELAEERDLLSSPLPPTPSPLRARARSRATPAPTTTAPRRSHSELFADLSPSVFTSPPPIVINLDPESDVDPPAPLAPAGATASDSDSDDAPLTRLCRQL